MTGVILAAGASRRMGSPKALLEFRGETFLARMARVLATACDTLIVVLAPGTESWAPPGAHIAINPDPDRGMLSSLQCGLSHAPGRRVLFTPLDYPALLESTVRKIAATPGEIVIPRHGGHRGHPVCVSAHIADQLLALPVATGTPADVIRRDPALVHYVDVDDPGILRDIDNPGDYRELLQSAASC